MASIGEEIKQKKFSSEYSKLMVNVLYTSSWLNSLQSVVFKDHKLTSQQFNSLRILFVIPVFILDITGLF